MVGFVSIMIGPNSRVCNSILTNQSGGETSTGRYKKGSIKSSKFNNTIYRHIEFKMDVNILIIVFCGLVSDSLAAPVSKAVSLSQQISSLDQRVLLPKVSNEETKKETASNDDGNEMKEIKRKKYRGEFQNVLY